MLLLAKRSFVSRASTKLKGRNVENKDAKKVKNIEVKIPTMSKTAADNPKMGTKQTNVVAKSRVFEDISNRRRPSIENPQIQKKAKHTVVEEILPKKVAKHPTPARKPAKKRNKTQIPMPQIPVPKPAVKSEETRYDLSSLSGAIDSVLSQPPVGVPNVDAEERDVFYNPEYAQDIMTYLMMMEKKYPIPDNYLESGQVTPKMRAVLVDWLVQLQNYLDLEHETLHMATSMLDQFLIRQVVALAGLQLVGVTCLLIACKFSERFTPQVSTLIHLTDNTYTFDQVIAMERKILKVLGFDIQMPLPTTFLDRYIKVARADTQTTNMARYLLDLSLHDFQSLNFSPSVKAAASLCLAGQIMTCLTEKNDNQEAWSRSLHYYSTYSEQQLQSCMQRYAKLLANSDQSKYKGAYKKYASTSNWKAISLTPQLTTCYIVHELTKD